MGRLPAVIPSFALPPVAVNSLAKLFTDHFLVPFAGVSQILVLVAVIATTVQRGLSHQDEHWGHALLRPVGIGVTGLGLIEICKLVASATLAGNLTL